MVAPTALEDSVDRPLVEQWQKQQAKPKPPVAQPEQERGTEEKHRPQEKPKQIGDSLYRGIKSDGRIEVALQSLVGAVRVIAQENNLLPNHKGRKVSGMMQYPVFGQLVTQPICLELVLGQRNFSFRDIVSSGKRVVGVIKDAAATCSYEHHAMKD